MSGEAKFAVEKLMPLRKEIEPLLEQHWREIAHYPDIMLKPDWDLYQQTEEAGALRMFTVRDVRTTCMVGYVIFWVRPNPHYADSLQAVQDVIFLHHSWRGSAIGSELIRFADDCLRNEGVQVVYHHVKLSHNWGHLLAAIGYEPVEVIHGRRLDRS